MENGLERAIGRLLPQPRQTTQPEPRCRRWADVRKNIGSGSTDPGRDLLGLRGRGVYFEGEISVYRLEG